MVKIRTSKTDGWRMEHLTALLLTELTGQDVSRRGRTVPDTGDIEGLHAHGMRVVVECKSTRKLLLPEQMRETIREEQDDMQLHPAQNSVGVLVKRLKPLHVGYTRQSMMRQPVITFEHEARSLGLPFTGIHHLDRHEGVWRFLSRITVLTDDPLWTRFAYRNNVYWVTTLQGLAKACGDGVQ